MFLGTVMCDTSRYLYWQISNLSERKREVIIIQITENILILV
jgi:hypothetical protein